MSPKYSLGDAVTVRLPVTHESGLQLTQEVKAYVWGVRVRGFVRDIEYEYDLRQYSLMTYHNPGHNFGWHKEGNL